MLKTRFIWFIIAFGPAAAQDLCRRSFTFVTHWFTLSGNTARPAVAAVTFAWSWLSPLCLHLTDTHAINLSTLSPHLGRGRLSLRRWGGTLWLSWAEERGLMFSFSPVYLKRGAFAWSNKENIQLCGSTGFCALCRPGGALGLSAGHGEGSTDSRRTESSDLAGGWTSPSLGRWDAPFFLLRIWYWLYTAPEKCRKHLHRPLVIFFPVQ